MTIARTIKRRVPALKTLTKFIEAQLDADKAEDIVTIDLLGKSTMADAMIVATGLSERQLAAMAEHLVEKLKHRLKRPIRVEGLEKGEWVLIDAGDVVIHLFRPESRAHYGLEKMWSFHIGEVPPERVAAVG